MSTLRAARIVRTGLCVLLCLLAAQTRPAQLGRAELASALGEPLSVTIELALAASESRDRLRATLASRAQHEAFGVRYDEYLRTIDIDVVDRGGALVLRLSSARVLDEFVLEFIVELRTPEGSILRRYTVLPEIVARPARSPRRSDASSTAPSAPGRALDTLPAPEKASSARPPIASGSSYLVEAGDSLWSIASRMDESIGPVRRRLALLRGANAALTLDDVLDVGDRLRIPSGEETALTEAPPAITAPAPRRETTGTDAADGSGGRARAVEALLRRARGRARVRLASVDGPAFVQRADASGTQVLDAAGADASEIARIRDNLDALRAEQARLTAVIEGLQRVQESGAVPAATANAAIGREPARVSGSTPSLLGDVIRPATLAGWVLAALLAAALLVLQLRRRARSPEETALTVTAEPLAASDGAGEAPPVQGRRARFQVPASIDGRTVSYEHRKQAPAEAPKEQLAVPDRDAHNIWAPTSILDEAAEDSVLREAVARARERKLDAAADAAEAAAIDEPAPQWSADEEEVDGQHEEFELDIAPEHEATDSEDEPSAPSEAEFMDESALEDLLEVGLDDAGAEDETIIASEPDTSDWIAMEDALEIDLETGDDDAGDDTPVRNDSGHAGETLLEDEFEIALDGAGTAREVRRRGNAEHPTVAALDDTLDVDVDLEEEPRSVAPAGARLRQSGAEAKDLMGRADLEAMEAWFEESIGPALVGTREASPGAPCTGLELALHPLPLIAADEQQEPLVIAELQFADEGPLAGGELPDPQRIRAALDGEHGRTLDRQGLELALSWFGDRPRSARRQRMALRIGLQSGADVDFVDEVATLVSAAGADRDRILLLVDARAAAASPARLRVFADLARMAGLGFGLTDAEPGETLDDLCSSLRPGLVRFAASDDRDVLGACVAAATALRRRRVETVVPTRDEEVLQHWLQRRRSGEGPDFLEVAPDLLDDA